MKIIGSSITLCGFIVGSLLPKYDEVFYAEIPARVARGEIKFTEDIRQGLQSVGKAIEDIQRGRNTGKVVVVVAEE